MTAAVAGGAEEFRPHPILTLMAAVTSPLALIQAVRAGDPYIVGIMVSWQAHNVLSETLLQQNADILIEIVLARLIREDALPNTTGNNDHGS